MSVLNNVPISVVILAHGRKEYLEFAIESVINQSLDRDFYEIVVVKNFKDDHIDEVIDSKDIKNVTIRKDYGSSFLPEAIENSSGEVLCFLDDDDLFHPDKLKVLYETFKDPNIGYYHNSVFFIDNDGNFTDKLSRAQPDSPIKLVKGQDYKSIVPRLIQYGADFNFGSVAIRRKILEDSIEYCKKVKISADSFTFYLSLLSDKDMLIDSRKLTYYRVHQSVSNQFGTFEYFIINRKQFLKLLTDDFTMMSEMSKGTIVQKFIETELSEFKVRLRLFDDEKSYRVSLWDYFTIFNGILPGRLIYHLSLLAASILSLMSSHYTRRMIYRKYMKDYSLSDMSGNTALSDNS